MRKIILIIILAAFIPQNCLAGAGYREGDSPQKTGTVPFYTLAVKAASAARIVRLNEFAGLPVALDVETGELILGEGMVSEPRWDRPLYKAGNSVADPEAVEADPDRIIYY